MLDITYEINFEQLFLITVAFNNHKKCHINGCNHVVQAFIKEMCRLWLARDCQATPDQMATLLLAEYTHRER